MQTILGVGFPLLATPERVRKRGHFSKGMTPTLKTVSTISLGFPEYGMTNANNCSPASNPHRVRNKLFNGMTLI